MDRNGHKEYAKMDKMKCKEDINDLKGMHKG
jgi:hypothetical protein